MVKKLNVLLEKLYVLEEKVYALEEGIEELIPLVLDIRREIRQKDTE